MTNSFQNMPSLRLALPQADSIATFDVWNVRNKGSSDVYFSTKNLEHLTKVFDFQELDYLLNYVIRLYKFKIYIQVTNFGSRRVFQTITKVSIKLSTFFSDVLFVVFHTLLYVKFKARYSLVDKTAFILSFLQPCSSSLIW